MTTLTPEVRDLLAAIRRAMVDWKDWRAVAVVSTISRVLDGSDTPGAAADWLEDFLAERERVVELEQAEAGRS
jgi:hypothetical protein